MRSIGDGPGPGQGGGIGVCPSTIVTTASSHNFLGANRFPGATQQFGWTALKNAIAAGHPVIGRIYVNRPTGNPRRYGCFTLLYLLTGDNFGHYLVITGLGAYANGSVRYVVVNEPAFVDGGGIKLTPDSFDAAWAGRNRRIIRLRF